VVHVNVLKAFLKLVHPVQSVLLVHFQTLKDQQHVHLVQQVLLVSLDQVPQVVQLVVLVNQVLLVVQHVNAMIQMQIGV
jgi:hypothetical protein